MIHTLPNEWQFWLISIAQGGGGQRQYQIEEIAGVGTVENFYQYYNALPPIHELKAVNGKRVSIALFLKEPKIRPAWEDTENEKGGMYYFNASEKISEIWFELLLYAIGGTIHEKMGLDPEDRVNGLICGPKKEPNFQFEIWVKKKSDQKNKNQQIEKFINEIINSVGIEKQKNIPVLFKAHKQ